MRRVVLLFFASCASLGCASSAEEDDGVSGTAAVNGLPSEAIIQAGRDKAYRFSRAYRKPDSVATPAGYATLPTLVQQAFATMAGARPADYEGSCISKLQGYSLKMEDYIRTGSTEVEIPAASYFLIEATLNTSRDPRAMAAAYLYAYSYDGTPIYWAQKYAGIETFNFQMWATEPPQPERLASFGCTDLPLL